MHFVGAVIGVMVAIVLSITPASNTTASQTRFGIAYEILSIMVASP